MTVVDDIKAQLDIVDIVSQSVKLRRTGKNYTGFCPFHSNTRTPAFVVFPETQTWRCFGQCNEGGDLFGYVMKREGWDFNETLKNLAEKAGITLTPRTERSEKEEQVRESIADVLELAVAYYRAQMLETQPGRTALDYLKKRGLTDETIKVWGLGYAPGGWNDLSNALKRKGVSQQLILQAGLLTERDDGSSYDKFRNRLMFPIREMYGKMVGFGGRVLDPEDVPKYMNSPRTDLFDKGRLLYGLDMARRSMRASEQAVIVEGYMDVIGLHQAGFTNAVSPMGTALTEEQFKLIKKNTRNIILALDPDAAGQNATLRGLDVARRSMDQEAQVAFDSRGLLHVESHLSADIRVTTLPEGKDPDEIVLADPESWQQIVADAKPIVVHVMETLAAGQDVNDAKVKREIAAQVMPLIEDVSDPVEREAYRQQLARLLRLDERVLRPAASAPTHTRRKRTQVDETQLPPGRRITSAAQRNRILEKHTLGFLVRQPEALYKINKALGLLQLSPLADGDFLESDCKNGFTMVLKGLEQDEVAPVDFVEEHLEDLFETNAPADLVEQGRQPSEEKTIRDQIRNILRMRLNLTEERIHEITFLQSELDEKPYTEEESQFLYLEQLNQRRLLDLAMNSQIAGGSGTAREASSIKSSSRRNA